MLGATSLHNPPNLTSAFLSKWVMKNAIFVNSLICSFPCLRVYRNTQRKASKFDYTWSTYNGPDRLSITSYHSPHSERASYYTWVNWSDSNLIRTRNWVLVFCVCVTESGISSTKKGGYRLQNIRAPQSTWDSHWSSAAGKSCSISLPFQLLRLSLPFPLLPHL